MDLKEIVSVGCGLALLVSGQGLVQDCCEYGNELLGSNIVTNFLTS
jgi:hypothetical protein